VGTNHLGRLARVDIGRAHTGYRLDGFVVLRGVVSVDQQVPSLGVLQIDRNRRVIEHRAQSFLAFGECPLGMAAVSEIAKQHQDERLAARGEHRGAHFHRHLSTGPGATFELERIGTTGAALGAHQASQTRHGVRQHPRGRQLDELAGRVFQESRGARIGGNDPLAQRIDDDNAVVARGADVRELFLDPLQALLAAGTNRALHAQQQLERIVRFHERREFFERAGGGGHAGKPVARVHHHAELRIAFAQRFHDLARGGLETPFVDDDSGELAIGTGAAGRVHGPGYDRLQALGLEQPGETMPTGRVVGDDQDTAKSRPESVLTHERNLAGSMVTGAKSSSTSAMTRSSAPRFCSTNSRPRWPAT
jgi:hypothetical protein